MRLVFASLAALEACKRRLMLLRNEFCILVCEFLFSTTSYILRLCFRVSRLVLVIDLAHGLGLQIWV